ncbi:MAG: sigma 54-interacting transcriptional regulator [Lachnospiraceae bacterium]|nr:sigma 54-interacting transcriptional regulator [Lachnospiraceae bacterium]
MSHSDKVKLYELILEHVSGTVFVTDAKGRIVYVNEAAAIALGCPVKQLLKMDIYELEKKGMTSGAVSIGVLDSKLPMAQNVHYFDGKENIVMGEPVFGEGGELEYVVVYGQKKNVLSERIQSLEKKNTIITQTLNKLVMEQNSDTNIIVSSPSTQKCIEMATLAAEHDSAVMLYGETGSGKDVFASYIHRHSLRKDKMFMAVNCAAIPKELMESELFGYEKGAFTGAAREGKIGLFQLADGGTLFLDEIGELDLAMQSKLLRVLESGEIRKVGGSENIKVDVRIIAATNRDLRHMIVQGTFREDLYYRLSVIPINVPPLRERKEDIEGLVLNFMNNLNRKYSTNKQFSQTAIEAFGSYSWPGNVRELRNVVERLYVITKNDVITERQVYDKLGLDNDTSRAYRSEENSRSLRVRSDGTLKAETEAFQRELILKSLSETGGNVDKSAEALDVSRSGLYKKMDALGIKKKY